MKNFEIVKRKQIFFIQSINYKNPINYLKEISNELSVFSYEGDVIFDLLLINGNSSNRFIITKFTNQNFDINSFKKITPSKDIRQDIIYYYKRNKTYLKNSILTPRLIELILNGKCLL